MHATRYVSRRRRLARRLVFVAAAAGPLALPCPSTPLGAQETRPAGQERRIPRRWIFTIVGALTGAAASSAYLFSSDDASMGGTCTDRNCVVPISVGSGALIGYLVGREFDQLHALRYRGGAPLKPPTVSAAAPAAPSALAVRDTLVAVGGTGGVQVFSSGESLRALYKRASGVRGIAALEVVPGGSLALGSAAGFYIYPPRTGPGSLVREGSTSAVVGAREVVYVGAGKRVEVVPTDADTTRSWPGIDLGAPVNALAYDEARQLVWALTDSAVISLKPAGDSLARVGSAPTGGRGRRVALQGTRLAIALGEGGVRLFDVADAAAPRETGQWTAARFVYDVSFAGRRLYVASGVEGVYVVDVSGARPATEGLARELGFAVALASSDGYTFVIDRTTDSVRRIPSDF